jgi:hypothetical protein
MNLTPEQFLSKRKRKPSDVLSGHEIESFGGLQRDWDNAINKYRTATKPKKREARDAG